jgi:hypothetical protein
MFHHTPNFSDWLNLFHVFCLVETLTRQLYLEELGGQGHQKGRTYLKSYNLTN